MPDDGKMTTALITGASSGIGRGFAEKLAAETHDLVLVARNQDRLEALASHLTTQYGVACEVLVADLSKVRERAKVERRLRATGQPVEILVNNAGFALNDPFLQTSDKAEQALLDVMVTAPMRLSHAVLPSMVERGRGAIVNVSSVAAWTHSGTYSAAKAYINVLSESLSQQLAGTGVTVTAVCPGLTHTELHQRAEMDVDDLPEWLWLDIGEVVDQGLADAMAGKAISVPSWKYKALVTVAKTAPRSLVQKLQNRR